MFKKSIFLVLSIFLVFSLVSCSKSPKCSDQEILVSLNAAVKQNDDLMKSFRISYLKSKSVSLFNGISKSDIKDIAKGLVSNTNIVINNIKESSKENDTKYCIADITLTSNDFSKSYQVIYSFTSVNDVKIDKFSEK